MDVQTKQQRIADVAQRYSGEGIKSLNHYIDLEWMREAYRQTRKDGAVGIDGVTAETYAEHLELNLQSLLERFKTGKYYAPAVKRAYIPKGGNTEEQRPIGIPTFEDKILQRAVCMVLEPVFEVEFLPVSFGFRRNHSAHQALEVIWKQAMEFKGCYVLKLDIQKYFDTVKHDILREFYKQRVCDGVIRRILGKWLKAGVMEKGQQTYPPDGTPQGGVVSPLLSNLYLHEVLDKWFEETIKPRLTSRTQLVRFADDACIMFESRDDAHRVLKVLGKRFERFGLTIHPEKTRLIIYHPAGSIADDPETFDFLGFTHYWGKSRRGNWVPKRKTAKDRLKRTIRQVSEWCRKHRHERVNEQHKVLCRMVRGHYNYYGITFNSRSLKSFVYQVKRSWHKWLNRRNRENRMNWEKFNKLLEKYPLPRVKIVHSYAA